MNIKNRLIKLIESEYSVFINFDFFCLHFNPTKTEEGGYQESVILGDIEIEIDITPEELECATFDDKIGAYQVGELVLEFYKLVKIRE